MRDGSAGRILVDPQGAALLSEDGVVVPGERVLVVGTFRKAVAPVADAAEADDDSVAQPSMMRRDRELTWFTRIGGWLLVIVGAILGLPSI